MTEAGPGGILTSGCAGTGELDPAHFQRYLELARDLAERHRVGEPNVVHWQADRIEAYVRAGRPDRAQDALAALGATPWATRAQVELGATGTTPRRRRHYSDRDRLTAHELQVALLVADGASNKEAAAALFLSPKTIEFHLARVYRKLGGRTRTELARLATRDGWLDGGASFGADGKQP
jgi:DNA-binding CsgD family transcriptional regulator